MSTVTGLTAERMLSIEAASVVSGLVDEDGHLILTKHDGSEIDAGNVSGAVPDENVVHYISASTFTDSTPPLSYPDGVSLMWMNSTQSTANWPTFSGKYGVIRTINMPSIYADADSTQVWTKLHGPESPAEQWIRSGRVTVGWSAWKRIAIDDDIYDLDADIVALDGRLDVIEPQVSGVLSAWTSYTPVWGAAGSAPSIGNGAIIGRYKLIGKTCHVAIEIQAGSTTAYGSGAFSITLPVAPKGSHVLSALFRDNSAATHSPCVVFALDGATTSFAMGGPAGAALTSASPVTWASSDRLVIDGSYEVT